MRVLLILSLLTHTAFADDVTVAGAPPITTQPEGGIDLDVTQRFDDAARLAKANDLSGALERVLVLYRSDDEFSRAQREPARPRAIALLGQIGSRARDKGDHILATRAFDARWVLGGERVDRDLAVALADWSAREQEASPSRALYLARRSHRADPDLVKAARLDHELSTNRRVWPMRGVIAVGLAAFGAGLYADSNGHDKLATGLYVASPLLCAGGALVGLSGVRNHSPVSPDELPSLRGPR
jgi:hypothetical protein